MGRGAHCNPEKRKIIFDLHTQGKNPTQIAKTLNCSRKMVYNAIGLVRANRDMTTENKIRKPPPRKTSLRIDRAIARKCKCDPFKSSRDIMAEVNEEFGVDVSSRLIRRRLNDAGLFGRVSRKKPLLSKKNIKARLTFAKTHKNKNVQFWKRVLWSDETKVNRIGPDGKTFVHRPKCQAYNHRYTLKTVKHGGGNLMVWGAFSWHGVGPLVRIDGRMDKFSYLNILKNTMEPFSFESMPVNWIFMHDNDPKHASNIVKDWLLDEQIDVLTWPAQSPDLNPIEHLWNDVKVKIGQKKFKNSNDLWAGIKEAWYSIPQSRCQKLVESLPRRCQETLKNRGHPTKY